MKLCTFEACENKHRAKGYCTTHYNHLIKYGAPQQKIVRSISRPNKKTKKLCDVDDCNNPSRARGLCQMHYTRNYKHGDPLTCYRRPRKSEYVSVDNILKEKGNYSKHDDTQVLIENFSDLYNLYDRNNDYY